jgi:energy-coupling factor transporter ATP-binding protein EcfA2
MTVVLAEHRLDRVAGWVDVALALDAGRVTAGRPDAVIGAFGAGPPVARLGRLLGWDPVPLTVRDARRAAGAIAQPRRSTGEPVIGGDVVASARSIDAGYGPVPALADVHLAVRQGEVVALMGRNGAGKSTLLRVLAGVHEPTRGDVSIADRPPRPGVDAALCTQDPGSLLFADTAEHEIGATLSARGAKPVAGRWLERLGIGHLADRHPRDVSEGERLLIAVAAVAATEAPLLLLDEPTRGLDPAAKECLVRFLRSRAAEGDAAVVATHDVELAAAVATRVVMLGAGEIVADGDPATVLGDSHVFAPQMTRVFGAGWLTPEQVVGALA